MTLTPPMAVKQMSKCSPAWHRATVARERALSDDAFPVLFRQLLCLLPVAMVTALQQPWWWDDHILLVGRKKNCTVVWTKQRSKKRKQITQRVCASTVASITSDQDIPPCPAVTRLAVKLTPHLTYNTHIQQTLQTLNLSPWEHRQSHRQSVSHLGGCRKAGPHLVSRLDYCSARLIRIPSKSIPKLQYI